MATSQNTKKNHGLVEGTYAEVKRQSCERCGGLCIGESLFDLYDETGRMRRWAARCIQCGDVVDSLILKHRSLIELPNPKPEHQRRWAKMQFVSN